MIKFLPWHMDLWLSRQGSLLPYDKLEHLLLALFGILIFSKILKWPLKKAILIAFVLSVGWEIKDGILPYDLERGLIQGFSWKDLIADTGGIILGTVTLKLLPKRKAVDG